MATYPERYDHIDFSVPEGVQDAFQRGLDLVAEGFGGDGLEDQTLREARSLADGEEPTVDKLRKMYRFWARNERFLDDDDKTSPAWVSAMLWGGRPGMAWSRSLVEQMDAADREAGVDSGRTNNARADERRILAYPMGKEIAHPAGDFSVDDAFASAMIQSFELLRDRHGYYPPILKQHVEDGFTYGVVSALEVDDRGVWASVQFADGMADMYDRGYMTHWSPSHYKTFQPSDTDEVLRFVLAELSFVALPHMLDVTAPSAHYDLPVRMSRADLEALRCQANPREDDMEDEMSELEILAKKIDELREALGERVSALEERMESMSQPAENAEEEPASMGAEAPAPVANEREVHDELVKMSRKIDELERANAKLSIKAANPGVSDEDVDVLAGMTEAQRAWALTQMSRKPTVIEQPQHSAGAAPVEQATDYETICRNARDAGITGPGAALISYARKHHGVTWEQYGKIADEKIASKVFGG